MVISGPSGVGKTTLEQRLIAADDRLVATISATTRPPREDDKTGSDYFFVERDVFEQMKDRELVEWAEVHGEYYGTPRRFVENEIADGRIVLLNIDVQGGIRIKNVFRDAVMVFIFPPSFKTLKERILGRGVDATLDLDTRLHNAIKEISASDQYDYIVVNDNLDEAVGQIQAIIEAERCRRERQNPAFIDSFNRQE